MRSPNCSPPIPGLPDSRRHRSWHYVDLGPDRVPVRGELDRRIVEAGYRLGWLLEATLAARVPRETK